jgi:CheY-like chemotaxis protein
VYLNLLNTAEKYSPAGARIELRLEERDGEVLTSVRDEGMGIAQHDLPRVFEMFYQGSAKPDDAQGGLGLGLALVSQLTELHAGKVEARSAGPGKGSEFVVRLPKLAVKPAAAAEAEPPHARVPAKRRILVVDDNRDAAETLALMLRLEGNEVTTVFDGESAIAATAEFRPDVVLMDLGMPKVDGYEAARAIRRERKAPQVVLIALTGWGGDVDRRMSQEAGFDRHLVKPVVPTELLEILSSLDQGATH